MSDGAYDAITVGENASFGTYEFTADRIKAFARQWDPQLFHVDEEKAKKSAFGALCASGWHTCSVMMRLQVDHYARRVRDGAPFRFGPSPGFEDLKWIRPVYAGDRITFASRVMNKRLSQSRPGMAIVTTAITGTNQHEKPVMSMTATVFVWVG